MGMAHTINANINTINSDASLVVGVCVYCNCVVRDCLVEDRNECGYYYNHCT